MRFRMGEGLRTNVVRRLDGSRGAVRTAWQIRLQELKDLPLVENEVSVSETASLSAAAFLSLMDSESISTATLRLFSTPEGGLQIVNRQDTKVTRMDIDAEGNRTFVRMDVKNPGGDYLSIGNDLPFHTAVSLLSSHPHIRT